MKIFIPDIPFGSINKKKLFILTRPFLGKTGWTNAAEENAHWNVPAACLYEPDLNKADVYFLPMPVQEYSRAMLEQINEACKSRNIQAYGIIGGDLGPDLGNYSNIIFFRMGGFKSQLGSNNKGFPVSLSDHFQRIFQQDNPIPSEKGHKPVIGFCGHATTSKTKRFKEMVKCYQENLKRFFKKPFRRDWEPIFSSAYERAKILNYFEKSSLVQTNFIYRNHYRAGAVTEENRTKTTLEYYKNIADSDYVLCVRGAGNFSVRLYETLMMGRIPVLVNTDCLLPFEQEINWKKHVVWIEWKDRKNCAAIVADFHQKISPEEFVNLQKNNRLLWKEALSINGILSKIVNERNS